MQERWAAWARQLAREYDSIVWQQRLPAMRAALEVAPLRSLWGSWLPERRCIVIAEALVRLHPWEVVLEVLKHEMAHQLAELQAPGQVAAEGPHGAAFRRACARLAVAPWAQASQLSPLRPAAAPSPGSRRLEKLWALASSPNPHEAAAALCQARRLEASLAGAPGAPGAPGGAAGAPPQGELDFVQICRRRRRIDRIDAQLVHLLTCHFAVQAVWVHTYDAAAQAHFRAVELLGRRRDLPFAAHVYHVVWAHLEAAWADARRRGGGVLRRRTSFMLGMLQGLGVRLAREASAAPAAAGPGPPGAPPGGAVAAGAGQLASRRELAPLAGFVARRHPRLSSLSRSGARRCERSWAAGSQEGERLALHRPLAGGPARPRRLAGRQLLLPPGR